MSIFSRRRPADECTDSCAAWCSCGILLDLNDDDDMAWAESLEDEL